MTRFIYGVDLRRELIMRQEVTEKKCNDGANLQVWRQCRSSRSMQAVIN